MIRSIFQRRYIHFHIRAAAGAVTTGFLLDKYFRGYQAKLYAMYAAANVLLAHMLKDGNAAIVLASAERRIASDVLIVSGNDDLKDTLIADTVLNGSKRFYVCTKTEIPPEIASIINALPPVEMADCVVN